MEEQKDYKLTPERLAQSTETRALHEEARQEAYRAMVNKLRREHVCLMFKSHDEMRALIDRTLVYMLSRNDVTLGTIGEGRFYFRSKRIKHD